MIQFKTIQTNGIGFVSELAGSPGWYWGMDHTSGDLYEAEELWQEGHRIRQNRLILLHFPEGRLFEPIHAKEGQYLGAPIWWEGAVWLLLADFARGELRILRWDAEKALTEGQDQLKTAEESDRLQEIACLPRALVKDCYNLQLVTAPLCLIRQGHKNDFQVVWPEQGDFTIDARESLDSRDGDVFLFSQWFEDPDYREETVLRRYPDGAYAGRQKGSLLTLPSGEKWVLE